MSKTQTRFLQGLFLVSATLWPWASPVALGEADPESFEVGASCAGLAYTTIGQLRSLLANIYPDDLHSFCFPEEAVECSEYTSLLKGEGKLVTGEDGYHCTMIPTH